MLEQNLNKKQTVITRLYEMCLARGNLIFDNHEVRQVCIDVGFGNHNDATKIDNSAGLPARLLQDDVFIIHLGREGKGSGRHRFVTGIASGYHQFEEIPDERKYPWRYRRSILNNINTSESNILSVCYNQRIIHDFLYEDIAASPKVYSSNRTQIPMRYRIGDAEINVSRVQVEIDFTLEHSGMITVFEAKNGEPPDFNIFQLFHPFRYYLRATADLKVKAIQCCYLLHQDNRLMLYLYSFPETDNPGSIQLERNAEYTLVPR